MQQRFSFELPDWAGPFVVKQGEVFATSADRMALAIVLSAENIKHGTGGPFGAAVFDDTGRLVAAGVNLVTSANCSILHAEMVAIALAQQALGRYDLSNGDKEVFELVASTEPCAMCFGAVPWSGVKRLTCGARKEDAEAVGFDEGAKRADWPAALEERGIEVIRDIGRRDAVEVLDRYAKQGGRLY